MENKDKSFFRKFIISLKDFEKYPELAIKSWKEVILYILILSLIFTFIASFAYTYVISNEISNTTDESFNELIKTYNIEGVTKKDLLEYFNGPNSIIMYVEVYLIVFICLFIINIINLIINVFILSMLGYFATIFMKMRIRWDALIKITIFSLTLPIILNLIVIFVETFTSFKIKNFELMYFIISYIYILAAISIIRMDIIKNKQELMNIIEEQKRVKEEIERQEVEKKKEQERKEKEEEKQNDEKDKKEDNDKKDKDDMQGEIS